MAKQERVAIVTGASGGIGRAAAVRLARDGMAVVVHFGGNRDRADETLALIAEAGGRAVAAGGDVADEEAMAAVFATATEAFGGVDVVVNAAGSMPLGPVAQMDLATFDRIIRTNLRGTFVVSQLAARQVRSGGAIVNFSSTVTRLQYPAYAAYAAAKGGVEAMTLILARELRGRDITVNTVAPGPVETPLFLDGKTDEQVATAAKANPMERLGRPEDIAQVVADLAGPSRWINGQVLFVNGGAA
ncbi:SDR family oxidoreductase [Actinoplanes sp. M2I2]|uniref:SDR family oxidoreductase n=1 Tax=Actinoplanes sp. M2I2 TaxID=1734444 RepID=UPI0020212793|nr:SDR family oxidoreductase [Actinoplanes sp. M2I2]